MIPGNLTTFPNWQWLLSGMSDYDDYIDHRVTNGIAITVTVVWSVAWLYGMISADYDMPTFIHAAFMIVITGIFGLQGVRGYTNGKK